MFRTSMHSASLISRPRLRALWQAVSWPEET